MKPTPYSRKGPPDIKLADPSVPYSLSDLYSDPLTRYSYADYLTWTDNVRRELIDGVVRLMSGVRIVHNYLTVNFTIILGRFIKRKRGKCQVFHAPVDVRLPKNR